MQNSTAFIDSAKVMAKGQVIDFLKLLDRGVCDLNVGYSLILTNELLDGLFAVRLSLIHI